ncbi:hypothetical protein [Klebsiella sp. BIGb0407]|uniref:hypothetical protein n=1 Tax=Klebsiella sp. BIGb0407 TaxID=2940603 RepID=UPI0021698352|nr:hypothetical protein [Klebsiella sp. BIGb0407]MCS3430146.1 hypothetical protein [Klebsiella sp. BIGb0407]
MRTVQEILDIMSPELRSHAEKAVEESRIFASIWVKMPSPSALNGLAEQSARYSEHIDKFA